MTLDATVTFGGIGIGEANRCLARWGHQMGEFARPNGRVWAHGLIHDRRIVGVTIASGLVRETCAGLSRSEAVELARLCAERPGLCRVVLRLWREFVLPGLCRQYGFTWAVSYQDESLHSGNTYRFDGWKPLARSRSGTDSRSGRKGRNKTIWGWKEHTNA